MSQTESGGSIRTGHGGMQCFTGEDMIEERLIIDTDYGTESMIAVAALRKVADDLEAEYPDEIDAIPPEVDDRIAHLHRMADKIEQATEQARNTV